MTKRRKKVARDAALPQQNHALAYATARRFDGGAVELRFVFQPLDAARVTDQIVHALVPKVRKR